MIKGMLFFLLLLTPPANAHIDFNFKPEYDDSYTSDVDPFAPRGLKMAYHSSVIVESIENEMSIGTGSGNYFKLGKHRFVMTAAHVVDGSSTIMIIERGFALTEAKVVYVDYNSDIAILKPVEKLKFTKPVPFRRDITNQIGEKTYHCGHPAREGWHISEGLLTGTRNDVLMVNTFAWPGSSGSVLFDEYGRVLGVLSSIRVDGPFGLPDMIEHIVLAGNIKTLDQKTLREVLKDVGE